MSILKDSFLSDEYPSAKEQKWSPEQRFDGIPNITMREEEYPWGNKPFRRLLNFEKSLKDRQLLLYGFYNCLDIGKYKPTKQIDKDLYREVRVFLERLKFFKLLKIKKCICAEEVFYRCLTEGPAFADYLDKCKFYTYKDNISCAVFDTPEEFVLEGYEGYDSIFPARYLIHWEEKVDDLPYGLIPETLKPFQIKIFKEWFTSLIKNIEEKELETRSLNQFWSTFKTSQNYNPATDKNLPGYIMYSQIPDKETECMLGKETKINVSPANIRDGVMPSFDDTDPIYEVHHFLSQITNQVAYSGMLRDAARVEKRLDAINRKESLFYMLDIRKCGITMPKSLIKAIGEVLLERFPTFHDRIKQLDMIRESRVIVNGGCIDLVRGYNLGWANEIPTLVQCTLMHGFNKRIEDSKKRFKALFYNDDSVISERIPRALRLQNSQSNEVFQLRLSNFAYERLSVLVRFFSTFLILNRKKIFASYKGFVFCERYFSPINQGIDMTKNSLRGMSLLGALDCYNISHAKYYYNDVFKSLPEEFESKHLRYLNEVIIGFWGIEFHKDEVSAPFEIGGWMTEQSYGLNRVCVSIDEGEFHPRLLDLVDKLDIKVTPNKRKFYDAVPKDYDLKKQRKYCNIDYIEMCNILSTDTYQNALSDAKRSSNPIDRIDAYFTLPEDELRSCNILWDIFKYIDEKDREGIG
jgi:hypothetical protein